jgi:spectrin beta
MADEENWIKEKEQIVTNGDIGHDLTTINLLLSKHKVDHGHTCVVCVCK